MQVMTCDGDLNSVHFSTVGNMFFVLYSVIRPSVKTDIYSSFALTGCMNVIAASSYHIIVAKFVVKQRHTDNKYRLAFASLQLHS
jgi:hypothetical protein